MAFDLVFSARAEEDVKAAIYYYDHINSELGERFFVELLDTYGKLSVSPQHYSFISTTRKSKIRDIKLPTFPYVVIFKILKNSVYIISVKNTNTKPLFS